MQRLIDRVDALDAEQPRYGVATVASLVEQLAVPAREVEAALRARGCFAPASLDAELDGSGVIPAPDLVEPEACDAAEARAMLEPLWRRLAPRDRMILRLRYVEDHTQRAIAATVGLTQAHVSRILAGLLEDLRSQLEAGVGSSRRAG